AGQMEGSTFGEMQPYNAASALAAAKPDELCLFSYTLGRMSRPKGVMVSHANLLDPAEVFAPAEGFRAGDEHIAYLPMAWVGNSLFSLAVHMHVGFTVNFPEKPETLRRDVREIGPTIALAPPRQWENALTEIMVRAADASPTKRRIFDFFRKVAELAQLCISERPPIPLGTCLLRGLGEFFVY